MEQKNRFYGIVQMYDKKRGYGTAESLEEVPGISEGVNSLKSQGITLKGITSSFNSHYNTKPEDPKLTKEIHYINNLYIKGATELKEGDMISYVPMQKGSVIHATEIQKVENKQSRGRSR